MDEEKQKIKEELYSLYKTILKNNNNILNISEIQNISSFSNLSLINNIKKSFIEILSFYEKYKENLLQLENIIKKLEFDVKYYLKYLLHYKIQNHSLETKIKAFASMEEDYEELKEKLKYEGGKFLENDRKDNEIMILRNENSKIKKEIKKLESQKVIIEAEYKDKIKLLENDKDKLNKKIEEMEKNYKKNNINQNNNLKINKTSKENVINKKLKRNNFNLSNIHNLINYSNNNFMKNNKQLVNFHSPKDELIYLERSRNKYNNNKTSVNTNLFTETYNKITNGLNVNKILFPFKKDINMTKYTRNKSLSVMKGRDFSESKTMSFNSNYFNKTESKQKTFNKIMNTKQQNAFSLNGKDLKNVTQFEKKYLNKNFSRITSAKNIKNTKI